MADLCVTGGLMSEGGDRYDVLVVGMINLDVVVEGFTSEMAVAKDSRVRGISFRTGGDAQNCAMTLARLGGKTAVSACTGDDHAGRICRMEMEAAGVDCGRLRVKPGQSGICLDLLTPGGEAMFVYSPGVNAVLRSEDVAWDLVPRAKIVSLHSLYNCGEIDLVELFSRARGAGAVTVADAVVMTGRQKAGDVFPAFAHLDYFMPSLVELEQISGCSDPEEGARRLIAEGVKNVVIKLGADGCLFVDRRTVLALPGHAVEVVDTTGAGDNFVAGFMYGLTRGMPLERCLAFANACGAVAVGSIGSNGAVRSAGQIEEFMRARA